ncbi:hypothetical protein F5B17DRAFT_140462 [Nemania serpens]|nr:hypothetical protein F5B17DRAFT_140462 [Nemania serpens]
MICLFLSLITGIHSWRSKTTTTTFAHNGHTAKRSYGHTAWLRSPMRSPRVYQTQRPQRWLSLHNGYRIVARARGYAHGYANSSASSVDSPQLFVTNVFHLLVLSKI